VKPAILIAVLAAGFHYWLDFDNKRHIVFAVLFGSCYFAFKELSKKTEKTADFIPGEASASALTKNDPLVPV
jgi:hypothetical protein